MSSAEQKYWLAPHVHFCVTQDYAVLLDLRRDKYIGVGREHLPALAAAIHGWPMPARAAIEPPASAQALLSKMLSTGMLTIDPAVGKAAQPLAIPPPQSPATEADLENRPRTTARDISQVLLAAAKAKALLKWRPIEAVVARVERRKQRAGSRFDLDAARPIVRAFLHLRPLFFTSKDECLFDSLVLIELLAIHRLFPLWLFGVSTNPFRAHSWVQAGDHVLNDQPERVCRFTPILAV